MTTSMTNENSRHHHHHQHHQRHQRRHHHHHSHHRHHHRHNHHEQQQNQHQHHQRTLAHTAAITPAFKSTATTVTTIPPRTTLPHHWRCADLPEDVVKATWPPCCPSRTQASARQRCCSNRKRLRIHGRWALQPRLLAHLPPCTTLPGHWCCADLQEEVAKATWTRCCPSRAQPSYRDGFVAAAANVRAFRGDQPALHNSTWPLVLRRPARGGGERPPGQDAAQAERSPRTATALSQQLQAFAHSGAISSWARPQDVFGRPSPAAGRPVRPAGCPPRPASQLRVLTHPPRQSLSLQHAESTRPQAGAMASNFTKTPPGLPCCVFIRHGATPLWQRLPVWSASRPAAPR